MTGGRSLCCTCIMGSDGCGRQYALGDGYSDSLIFCNAGVMISSFFCDAIIIIRSFFCKTHAFIPSFFAKLLYFRRKQHILRT